MDMNDSPWIELLLTVDWSAWVTAGATLLLAFLTFIYVRLTKKLVDSQSDPYVVVSAAHDSDRPTIIQLVVRNVGTGLARDITFEFSRPLPAQAWGLTVEGAKDAEEMTRGPLIDGIPGLGPRDERRLDWGQYGGLLKALGDEPVLITSHFRKGTRRMPAVVSGVDVKSFEGTNASKSVNARVATEMEKIARDLNHLATGFYKLRVMLTEKDEPTLELDEEDEKEA